ncbi:MAG: hypothetical protein FJ288_01730 [Planctomycetes bacterium]|nr:hypothetical protein [Planctomycetota bacterium]
MTGRMIRPRPGHGPPSRTGGPGWVLAALCLGASASGAIAATYYASPDGQADGRAPEKPLAVARFWAAAKPGDTLVLLDGTYRGAESMIAPPPGLFGISARQPRDAWFENCAAIVEDGAAPARPFSLRNADGRGLTAVGGSDIVIKGGEVGNVLRAAGDAGRAAWKAMLQPRPPQEGAHIYYRYENGKLTDKPLWPWPMNERIKELIGLDVTATVFGLGGP